MTVGTVLYVYYKVAATQHVALAPRVRQFQADLLQRFPGLHCELLQRPTAVDGIETWMETYRHVGAVDDAFDAAVELAATDAGLPAPRHTERFVPLD